MDPQATWSQLQDACRDQEWDAVDELAQSLLNWLARGGFAPVTTGGDPNDAAQQRELVIHFCESVLHRRTPNSFAN